jgi:glutathione synthase/RimK-type ligase-like ATP-grasp enzyme
MIGTSDNFVAAVHAECKNRGYFIETAVQSCHLHRVTNPLTGKSCLTTGTFSTADSHIGCTICTHKDIAYEYMRGLGLPLPQQIVLNSPRDLPAGWPYFEGPVVVKPSDKERGEGVTMGIHTMTEALHAAQKVANISKSPILLQSQIKGREFRINLFNGKIAFVVERCAQDVNKPANLALGGERKIIETSQLDSKLDKVLSYVAKDLGMFNLGVDIIAESLSDFDKVCFLELNSGPALFSERAVVFVESLNL